MLFVFIIFGLIGTFAPGWFMSCLGMGAELEQEGCLVWFFRLVGMLFVGIGLWFLIARH